MHESDDKKSDTDLARRRLLAMAGWVTPAIVAAVSIGKSHAATATCGPDLNCGPAGCGPGETCSPVNCNPTSCQPSNTCAPATCPPG